MFRDKDPDQKREEVLATGTEVRYMVCPLCGMNKSLKKYLSGQIAFTNIDFGRMHIVQVRRGGGRGRGFYLDRDSSLLISEIKDDPEYQAILQQIIEQCKNILRELE